MDVTGVSSSQAAVKVQKTSSDQKEAVIGKILEGVKQADVASREFHSTGHKINVKA